MSSQGADPRLSDSGQHLRLLSDAAPDYGLLILDPRGIVVGIGAPVAGPEVGGDIVGQPFARFYTPEDRAAGKPAQDLRVAGESGRFNAVETRLRRDGSGYSAAVVITPIRDAGGAIIGFGEVTRDITRRNRDTARRHRSEQAVLDGAARLRAIVDTAVDGLILIDARGAVQMFNPACERLFGYSEAEVLGKDVTLLMPAAFRGQHALPPLNDRRREGRTAVGIAREVVGRRKDGTAFQMELCIGTADLAGETSFVGVVHDLTDRQRVDAQLVQAQKMEMVGQLAGGIAHDFNNLLTVIIGNADMLADMLPSRPDLSSLSSAIISAGERGAELTQRLLAFGRRQTLRPQEIDCNRQIEGMQQLLRRTLRDDIDLDISLDPMLKAAYADPAQLEAAILNLALNAQDAMPGGGRLGISTKNAVLDAHFRGNGEAVEPGAYVLISVTDNGEGMTPETRERAFEPFYTTKDIGKGSGLGLSMTYGFVKQSRGHASLSSEVGHGTTVRLYLPPAASLAGLIPAAPAAIRRRTPRGSESVLIVEDDPFVLGYASDCLKSLGYRVIAAADANEALARLRQGAEPDMLFSDIVMAGGINGVELAERACRMRPGLKVLLTSGYGREVLAATVLLDAGTAVLGKPYRKSELADALRRTLDAAQ